MARTGLHLDSRVRPHGVDAIRVLRIVDEMHPSQSLVDQATIDGVGPLKILVRVLFPMSRSILAAVAVIVFMYAWNQYLWPAVVIDTERNQVAQVGLSQLGGGPIAMAGAILTRIPPLIVLIVFHRTLLSTLDTQLGS